jgi:hypothetical protein
VIFLIHQPKYLESLLEVLIKNVAIANLVNSKFGDVCGCSSVVERHVANVAVVGSSPITRFVVGRKNFECKA